MGRPEPSYHLVDLSALDGYDLESADVAGALVQLERAKTADAFRAVAERLADMLASPDDAALRRAFATWIADLMKARKLRLQDTDITQLLAGGKPMIAETMDRWTQEWLQQGRAEGLQQQKAMVQQQAERKFGLEVAMALGRLLEPAADSARVRDVALAIVDCDSGTELLDRVGSLAVG